MTPAREPIGVLFVCLGNICRSPLAEGIFIHIARERGVLDRFRVDSAGTGGWHVGNPPDPRSVAVARKHGIELPSRARTFDDGLRESERFEWLIAMDRENEADMLARGAPRERVHLMMSFHPNPPTDVVPDPYYGGPNGFDEIYELLTAACEGLLDRITAEA